MIRPQHCQICHAFGGVLAKIDSRAEAPRGVLIVTLRSLPDLVLFGAVLVHPRCFARAVAQTWTRAASR